MNSEHSRQGSQKGKMDPRNGASKGHKFVLKSLTNRSLHPYSVELLTIAIPFMLAIASFES
jgi:hypothetical protein